MQIRDSHENYPVPFENSTMWKDAEVVWIQQGVKDLDEKDLAVVLAYSGYFQ